MLGHCFSLGRTKFVGQVGLVSQSKVLCTFLQVALPVQPQQFALRVPNPFITLMPTHGYMAFHLWWQNGRSTSFLQYSYIAGGQSVAFQAHLQLPIPKFPRKVFMAGFPILIFFFFPVSSNHPRVEERRIDQMDYSIGRFALEFRPGDPSMEARTSRRFFNIRKHLRRFRQ